MTGEGGKRMQPRRTLSGVEHIPQSGSLAQRNSLSVGRAQRLYSTSTVRSQAHGGGVIDMCHADDRRMRLTVLAQHATQSLRLHGVYSPATPSSSRLSRRVVVCRSGEASKRAHLANCSSPRVPLPHDRRGQGDTGGGRLW